MDDDEKKMKKIKVTIIVLMVLMLLLFSAAVVALVMLQAETFKFKLDGVSQSNYSETLFQVENDDAYVSIKEFAKLLGYETFVGEYKQFEEDETKCYIQNNYQIVSFEYDSNVIYKTNPNDDSEYEYWKLDKPVKKINNELYISSQGVAKAFNMVFSYDASTKTAEGITLNSLVRKYAALSESYFKADEQEIKEDQYNNAKALLYGYVIVQDEKNNFGIVDVNGKEIVGKKYKNITFVENSVTFYVKTSDGKIGMISSDGITRIKPEYDDIVQMDKDLAIYLVTKNNKKGIVDSKGNILLYIEYDQIGIDTSKFTGNTIKNKYIIYSNYIPVKKDKKWGIKVISNQTIKDAIPLTYEEIGTGSSKDGSGLVLVPDYKAFIFMKDKKYGIVNVKGEELVPFALSSVYSSVSDGKQEYWMVYETNTINVLEYLKNLYATPTTDTTTTNTATETTQTTSNQ